MIQSATMHYPLDVIDIERYRDRERRRGGGEGERHRAQRDCSDATKLNARLAHRLRSKYKETCPVLEYGRREIDQAPRGSKSPTLDFFIITSR